MKIIITGSSGFLGRHLCRALTQAGHQLKLIDVRQSEEFPTIIADVRDLELMKTHIKDAEVVFHLASLIEAGESVELPQKYFDVNVTGTINILEAMRLNGVKTLIFSSSAAIYGEPLSVPIKENDRTLPINPYGMTKLAMEGLLSSYVKAFGLTGVALRYFNLYGPGEHHEPETHAIPRFIKQIYQGDEVTVWGHGQHQRDYIYISDIVTAHLKALDLVKREPNKYHYLNLSTGQPNSVLDIIQKIERVMGKKAQIKHFPERPGDPLVLTADATKAQNILGWSAQVDLDQGLGQTVKYFLDYFSDKQ